MEVHAWLHVTWVAICPLQICSVIQVQNLVDKKNIQNMTVQLTVHVTLMYSCVGLGKTTRAVVLKAAGATQHK